MTTNRAVTNAVRKALREADALTPVDRVTTRDDLVHVDGRQVSAHVTRVMLEPTLGGLSTARIATVLRKAGFSVYAAIGGYNSTAPHIEIHTPRVIVAEVVTRALVEGDDATIEAVADGFHAATGRPTAYERADAANGAAEVRAKGDVAELLKPANERRLRALDVVAECSDTFRSRIVPAGGSRFTAPSARALVRMGLLTEHTIPHKGFRITERGRRALDGVRTGRKRATTDDTPRKVRCDSPSTRGATSAEHYTDCRGWLDAPGGECPEAGGHVRL